MIIVDANASANFFGPDTNHFNVVNGSPSASMDMGGYINDFSSNRNPIPQTVHCVSGHYTRGVRSSYIQRPVPAFRASSSNLSVGNTSAPDEGLQPASENYTSRHPRLFPSLTVRNGERHGRNRITVDRYRTFPNDAGSRDRLTSEVCRCPLHELGFFLIST